jgi:ribosomal protein L40E
MCGYACIGCGACGRPKSKLFQMAGICPHCKATLPEGTFECELCGYSIRPGQAMGKAKTTRNQLSGPYQASKPTGT